MVSLLTDLVDFKPKTHDLPFRLLRMTQLFLRLLSLLFIFSLLIFYRNIFTVDFQLFKEKNTKEKSELSQCLQHHIEESPGKWVSLVNK